MSASRSIPGRQLVAIDRWEPTTRRCAACGHIGETLSLSVRSVGQLAGTAASSEARTVAADRNRLERAAG